MKYIAKLLFISLFFLSSTTMVSAEIRSGALTLTPFAGWLETEGNSGVEGGINFGLGIGYNFSPNWSGEIIGSVAQVESSVGNLDGHIFIARVEAIRHFPMNDIFIPHLAIGAGYFGSEINHIMDSDAVADYGLGCNIFMNDSIALRLDIRHLLNFNVIDDRTDRLIFNDLLSTVGLAWQFYGNSSLEQRSIDTDGDGIVDGYDRCPGTKPGTTVDSGGCEQDPRLEEHLRLAHELTTDNDLDGVPNNVDRCPNTPTNTPVNSLGCPADTDGDGIYDIDDTCPDTPPGSIVNAAGCLMIMNGSPARIKDSRIGGLGLLLEFHPGKASILPEFEADLDKAANFIGMHPDEYFYIDGHTDSVGPDEVNIELSIKRAENVRNWLITRYHIAGERLIARGFGERQPIADNSTQEGRNQNRRVMIIPAKGRK